jgi:hypothetical protein
VVTAKELWSKNRLTCSTDSPASLRSLAAECRFDPDITMELH